MSARIRFERWTAPLWVRLLLPVAAILLTFLITALLVLLVLLTLAVLAILAYLLLF